MPCVELDESEWRCERLRAPASRSLCASGVENVERALPPSPVGCGDLVPKTGLLDACLRAHATRDARTRKLARK